MTEKNEKNNESPSKVKTLSKEKIKRYTKAAKVKFENKLKDLFKNEGKKF